MLNNSVYGKMTSTIPPSTIVAWTSMLSGFDPSHFNVYSYTYTENDKLKLINSNNVK